MPPAIEICASSLSRYSQRKAWQAVSAVLILCGIVSCVISSQADVWWNKSFHSLHHPQVARIINQASRPLLISDASGSNPRNVISLSYLLDPKVRLQLVVDPHELAIHHGFSDVFVFDPSASLKQKLDADHKLEAVYRQGKLWRLSEKP